MGALECCLGGGGTDYDVETPDPEVKRQQMLEAAERRRKQEDSRGLKNPERFHEQQRVRYKFFFKHNHDLFFVVLKESSTL